MSPESVKKIVLYYNQGRKAEIRLFLPSKIEYFIIEKLIYRKNLTLSPEHAIATYWNDISSDAPNTDFMIYNIPQLAGGIALGSEGGIGGTYGAMTELYLAIYNETIAGNRDKALKLQLKANEIIKELCSCTGNMYAVIKEVLRIREGVDIGGVRKPLAAITSDDTEKIKICVNHIDEAIALI